MHPEEIKSICIQIIHSQRAFENKYKNALKRALKEKHEALEEANKLKNASESMNLGTESMNDWKTTFESKIEDYKSDIKALKLQANQLSIHILSKSSELSSAEDKLKLSAEDKHELKTKYEKLISEIKNNMGQNIDEQTALNTNQLEFYEKKISDKKAIERELREIIKEKEALIAQLKNSSSPQIIPVPGEIISQSNINSLQGIRKSASSEKNDFGKVMKNFLGFKLKGDDLGPDVIIQQYQEHIKHFQATILSLEQNLLQSNERGLIAEKEIERLLKENEGINVEFTEQVYYYRNLLNNSSQELQELRDKSNILEKENDILKMAANESVNRAVNLEESMLLVNTQNDQLKEMIRDYEQKLSISNFVQLFQESDDSEDQIAFTNHKIVTPNELAIESVSMLKNECNLLKRAIAKQVHDNKELQQDIKSLQDLLKVSDENVQKKIIEYENQIVKLKADLDQSSSTFQNISNKPAVIDENTENGAKLRKQIEELKMELQEKELEINETRVNFKETFSKTFIENEDLRAKVEELKNQKDQNIVSVNTSNLNNVAIKTESNASQSPDTAVTAVNREFSAIDRKMSLISLSSVQAQAKLQEADAKLIEALNEGRTYNNRANQLALRLKEAETKLEIDSNRAELAEKDLAKLQKMNEILNSNISTYEVTISKLNNEISECKNELNLSNSKLANYENRAIYLENRINQLIENAPTSSVIPNSTFVQSTKNEEFSNNNIYSFELGPDPSWKELSEELDKILQKLIISEKSNKQLEKLVHENNSTILSQKQSIDQLKSINLEQIEKIKFFNTELTAQKNRQLFLQDRNIMLESTSSNQTEVSKTYKLQLEAKQEQIKKIEEIIEQFEKNIFSKEFPSELNGYKDISVTGLIEKLSFIFGYFTTLTISTSEKITKFELLDNISKDEIDKKNDELCTLRENIVFYKKHIEDITEKCVNSQIELEISKDQTDELRELLKNLESKIEKTLDRAIGAEDDLAIPDHEEAFHAIGTKNNLQKNQKKETNELFEHQIQKMKIKLACYDEMMHLKDEEINKMRIIMIKFENSLGGNNLSNSKIASTFSLLGFEFSLNDKSEFEENIDYISKKIYINQMKLKETEEAIKHLGSDGNSPDILNLQNLVTKYSSEIQNAENELRIYRSNEKSIISINNSIDIPIQSQILDINCANSDSTILSSNVISQLSPNYVNFFTEIIILHSRIELMSDFIKDMPDKSENQTNELRPKPSNANILQGSRSAAFSAQTLETLSYIIILEAQKDLKNEAITKLITISNSIPNLYDKFTLKFFDNSVKTKKHENSFQPDYISSSDLKSFSEIILLEASIEICNEVLIIMKNELDAEIEKSIPRHYKDAIQELEKLKRYHSISLDLWRRDKLLLSQLEIKNNDLIIKVNGAYNEMKEKLEPQQISLPVNYNIEESKKELISETSKSMLNNSRKKFYSGSNDEPNYDDDSEKNDMYEDDSIDLEFFLNTEGKSLVKSGPISKLVDRLVDPKIFDLSFLQTFILCYPLFMSPDDLLDLLISKFANEISKVQDAVSSDILRIVSTMKYWIDNFFNDFESNETLMHKMNSFLLQYQDHKVLKSALSVLIGFIQKRLQNIEPDIQINIPLLYKKASISNQISMKIASKKGTEKALILRFDPQEIAKQLSVIESQLFSSILPREFIDLNWTRPDKDKSAPNIMKMTNWSNHVIFWLISEIVSTANIKIRAKVFEHVIMIAHYLEKLNNFNGIKEVIAALQSASVYRLTKTQKLISNKNTKSFESLKALISSELNYKNLRNAVHSSQTPLIPFPGVYQGDFVFLDTCGKNILEGGAVNFQKLQKLSSYVSEIQTYQKVKYNIPTNTEIQNYIQNFQVLDSDEAFTLSLECEAKSA